MSEQISEIAELLHQAAETHHVVFAITDGTDADWATWYSDWLVNLSRLPELLGTKPVRSELTYLLVGLDQEFTRMALSERWEEFYARRLVEHFGAKS
jgi:hypothetical protein